MYSGVADDGGRCAGVFSGRDYASRDFGGLRYLTEEDIRACLAFAADRERRLETMVA